jgi:hypothetical protein
MRPLVSLPGGRDATAQPRAATADLSTAAAVPDGGSLGVAAPILQLLRGGVRPATETTGGSSSSMRFFDEPQPLVSSVVSSSSDAAQKMIEAVQKPVVSKPSDDRISLADLTLISIASATQQVAASAAGAAPAANSAAAPSGGASGAGGGAKGAASKGAPDAQEVERLAQQVFDELQRRLEIERERGGYPWES